MSIYTGRLIGSAGAQSPEVDLGVITSIRYTANETNNQSIAIVAKKLDKTSAGAATSTGPRTRG